MAAVDFDRQAIERRDFPIGRRGYDTAAVDAHLAALAGEFEELQRSAGDSGGESLASSAGSQVQSILAAAETAAAEIERQALAHAQRVREDAARDAERTRDEAVEKARGHVAAVAQITARLMERVGTMDGEVSGLIESLRAGAGRLGEDLAAVETGMGELYDAASGRAAPDADSPAPSPTPVPAPTDVQVEASEQIAVAPSHSPAPPAPARTPPERPSVAEPAEAGGADLDGARLIALNMALNGKSRADTERYLAENYQLVNRPKLVEEVYAAIEA
jgi:hypothetical protein